MATTPRKIMIIRVFKKIIRETKNPIPYYLKLTYINKNIKYLDSRVVSKNYFCLLSVLTISGTISEIVITGNKTNYESIRC
jgi:hypothetical protein